MTILLTGGTGKTGLPLARLLQDANQPFLMASRGVSKVPERFQGTTVKFDWHDSKTYENPFNADKNVDRVYLVCSEASTDMLSTAKPFIEVAIANGVKRFVLLSATTTPLGSPAMGTVHQYLVERGVDYCVLRPTWFMENFESELRLPGILGHDEVVTASGDGRIPWVSVEDIAAVAFRALTDEKSHNTEHLIVGPELYNYDEVVKMLSEIVGRNITLKKLSDDDSAMSFWQQFLPKDFAEAMFYMEKAVASSEEAAHFHAKDKEVGKKHLRDYFEANQEVWIKK